MDTTKSSKRFCVASSANTTSESNALPGPIDTLIRIILLFGQTYRAVHVGEGQVERLPLKLLPNDLVNLQVLKEMKNLRDNSKRACVRL